MHGIIQLNMFYNDLHHKIFSASRPSGDRLPEGDFLKAERPKEEAESKEYGNRDCHGDDYHQVSFVGEPGLDMGGLTKEWFQVLKTFFFGIFELNAQTVSTFPLAFNLLSK